MKILCIDDEPLITRVISRVMHDHDVVEYSDSCAAIRHLTGDPPPHYDVVVCDIIMPQCSGLDVWNAIVESRPELRDQVVFSTGAMIMPGVDAFLDSVPNAKIDKPFRIDHLRSVLLKVGVRPA